MDALILSCGTGGGHNTAGRAVEQAQTAGTALGLTAAAFALAAAAVLLARTSAHGERSRNYDDFPGED